MARKQAPLVLLADATGQTANVGTLVPAPWTYEYQYPIDCMKVRFVPWNQQSINAGIPAGNIQSPPTPLTTGMTQQNAGQRLVPARFLVATDFNYPEPPGQITWEVQGVSPEGRTVILTNVQNAQVVYTALMRYPSVWDALFRAAFVSYLASEIALPLSRDKKLGMALRNDQIRIAKEKIMQARVTNGNETWSSSDLSVDWMQTRSVGGSWYGGVNGGNYGDNGALGVLGYGWDACGFSNSSAF